MLDLKLKVIQGQGNMIPLLHKLIIVSQNKCYNKIKFFLSFYKELVQDNAQDYHEMRNKCQDLDNMTLEKELMDLSLGFANIIIYF